MKNYMRENFKYLVFCDCAWIISISTHFNNDNQYDVQHPNMIETIISELVDYPLNWVLNNLGRYFFYHFFPYLTADFLDFFVKLISIKCIFMKAFKLDLGVWISLIVVSSEFFITKLIQPVLLESNEYLSTCNDLVK